MGFLWQKRTLLLFSFLGVEGIRIRDETSRKVQGKKEL